MSGIGGVLHWDGRPVQESTIRAMMERIPHRGPDGLTWDVQDDVGLGAAELALTSYDRPEQQPVWSEDRSLGLVAAARIYNRSTLLSHLGDALGAVDSPSDAAILMAGYQKWGMDLVDRLDGDFAFAIWDRQKQELSAARDPFGLRPFFYSWTPEGLRFGSEPKQLVNEAGSLSLNGLPIGDFLLGRTGAYRETFVEGIERLEPGHVLVASAQGVTQKRYWQPWKRSGSGAKRRAEVVEGFRNLFERSVAKRLQVESPAAAQLSGGLDSSAVVAIAGELYRSGTGGLPELVAISEIYPGLDCDESQYIRTVQKTVPFGSCVIDCSDLGLLEDPAPRFFREDSPDLDMAGERTELTAEVLNARDVRVLLTGLAGDELIWEPTWIPDLIRTGRWLEAGREARRVASRDREVAASKLLVSGAMVAVPQPMRRALQSLRGPRLGGSPPWLRPGFAEWLAAAKLEASPGPVGFPSQAQEQAYCWLTSPLTRWNLERAELRMAYHGIEVRHPFLDRELVEFVLGVPWRVMRVPGGSTKPLLRDAVGDLFPEEIRDRAEGMVFNDFFLNLMRSWMPRTLATLQSTNIWLSEVYTRRGPVLKRLEEMAREGDPPFRQALQLWAACNLELWMRGRYAASQDELP